MATRGKDATKSKSDWITPVEIFEEINKAFNGRINLDVAASESNKKCNEAITKEQNALHSKTEWGTATSDLWWCNPPFSKGPLFIAKAWEQMAIYGHQGIMLVPSNQETKWFRNLISHPNLARLVYPKRIQFIDPDTLVRKGGNNVGTVLLAFLKQENMHLLNPFKKEAWVRAMGSDQLNLMNWDGLYSLPDLYRLHRFYKDSGFENQDIQQFYDKCRQGSFVS